MRKNGIGRVSKRCGFLSLVLRRVGVGESGCSEGVELLPRPLAGDPGGVEVVELRLDCEDRPLVLLEDPFVCNEWFMSRSPAPLLPPLDTNGGVDCTHFLLEGGGVRGGGERESDVLFMALEMSRRG